MTISAHSLRPARNVADETPTPPAHPQHRTTLGLARKFYRPRLGVLESVSAFVVFALWLCIFAGGILVDTEPYRVAISSGGADLLRNEPMKGTPGFSASAPAMPSAQALHAAPGKVTSWTVVLLCFLPLNLVWVCAAASALGAFGNRANLGSDQRDTRSRDDSNPYLSAVLRGFFAYLFMTSGLLLLDDAPFSHPSPGQYIRLAGFLSLLCFVVSYQPRLFNTLIVWAFHRIEVREGKDPEREGTETETVHATHTTLDVTARHTPKD
jgi:hypothetical protein